MLPWIKTRSWFNSLLHKYNIISVIQRQLWNLAIWEMTQCDMIIILTPKQLGHFFFFKMQFYFLMLSNISVVIFIWNWSNTMNILSALWILMAWCFITRASVATVLTTHPGISRCLRVKALWTIWKKKCDFHVYFLAHLYIAENINSLNLVRCRGNSKSVIYIFILLISRVLFVKFALMWHRMSLMMSQYWFRLLPDGTKPLSEPMLTQICITIWHN